VVEVVFEKPITITELNPKLIAGIDLGLDNLVTLVSNKPGLRPILVDGKKLKSINQGYNKRKAHLQSRLAQGKHSSKQIQQITFKRNKRVDDYLHLTSRIVVNRLVEEEIAKLVIGQNQSWKQEIELGRINNQSFVNIPHAKLIEMITYKAQLVGVEVVVTEESYTSKTSFLDLEPVGKQESYPG
jgi:putative transposase